MNNCPILRKDIYILVLMMLAVPLAGELNFYPFNETFRVSFGAPTFFFFLLLFRKIPSVIPGFLTGAWVAGFRILLDYFTHGDFVWVSSFHAHYSSFFYYFTFSVLVYWTKLSHFDRHPLVIGGAGIVIEILSDLSELLAQSFLLEQLLLTLEDLHQIILIAFSHSFIVISFFSIMKLYEAQSRERQIRKQNEHMLMLVSNLFEESIHLKKTLQNAESITKKSYDLYRSLNRLKQEHSAVPLEECRKEALEIAGEVHEIKKDNQRIFAGLSKLISDESTTDYMDLHQLVDIIVRTNEKYAQLLGKDIQFTYGIKGTHPPYHAFIMLSIINNIVANAVEAIQHTGNIEVRIRRNDESVEFQISDDGPGILPKQKHLIFKPGFTSKYDLSGTPSTGIGLSYTKVMVEQLEGDIAVEDGQEGKRTTFSIRLPIINLTEKG